MKRHCPEKKGETYAPERKGGIKTSAKTVQIGLLTIDATYLMVRSINAQHGTKRPKKMKKKRGLLKGKRCLEGREVAVTKGWWSQRTLLGTSTNRRPVRQDNNLAHRDRVGEEIFGEFQW